MFPVDCVDVDYHAAFAVEIGIAAMPLMRTVALVVLQMRCCSEAFYLNVNTFKTIFTQADTEDIKRMAFFLTIVKRF